MKKKIVAIILSMSMIMTSLMGCGKTSEETQTAQQNSESNEAGQEKEQDAEKEEVPSQEDVRIALLLSGNLGDMSFLDSANKGTSQIMADYGAQVKVIEMGSDATKYETNVLDASDEGYDIIIGSGWQLQEPFQNVAKDYPDIK